MTAILCPVRSSASQSPHLPAMSLDRVPISFLELDRLINKLAGALITKGIKPGDLVAIEATASSITAATVMACFRIGALALMIPSTPMTFTSIDIYCPKLVVTSSLVYPPKSDIIITHTDLLTIQSRDYTSAILSSSQPSLVVPTSGSSGTPKLAVLTIENWYYSALGLLDKIRLEPGDKWLLSVPLHHVSGLSILFRAFISGATVFIDSQKAPILETVFHNSISHLSLVPTQLNRILADPLLSASTHWPWQFVMVSGSEIPPDLIHNAIEAEVPIHTAYGLTETASAITLGIPTQGSDSGELLPFRNARVAPDGVIEVSGKTLFYGYLESEKMIRLPLTSDGWFRTNDIGVQIDNRWRIIGRTDDMIISGGENIHPSEIEQVIRRQFPNHTIIVVGKKDHEFGERPVAIIDPFIPLEDLSQALKPYLPRFKLPIAVFGLNDAIVTTGKLNRKPWKKWVNSVGGD